MMPDAKIFIVGLPRTGTTSLCDFLLQQGLKTAHCAYTPTVFELATVLADTPIFTDYDALDKRYPNSKFILSTRPIENWLDSISLLLQKMSEGLFNNRPMFHPEVSRCFHSIFAPLNTSSAVDREHLKQCFIRHTERVKNIFEDRPSALLIVDIESPLAHEQIAEFLNLAKPVNPLKKLNRQGTINDWQRLDHHLKIKATRDSK